VPAFARPRKRRRPQALSAAASCERDSIEVAASHSVALSQPTAVADLIRTAVSAMST